MEAQHVRGGFKQLQEKENQVCFPEKDQGEFLDCTNSSDSAVKPTKQRSSLNRKKRMVQQKPSNIKSKAKQVIPVGHGKSGSCKKKRTRIEDLYDSDDAKFSVMERAEEVLANAADGFPSFLKCMLPSNVSRGFWLILPKNFCNLHLPRHDTTVILVDECGERFEANYLVERHGLSGGWRGFSLAHRLLKGDVLVFHLINPCTLKVDIVRVYGLDDVDAALCLMDLASDAKTSSDKKNRPRKKMKKCVEPLPLDVSQIKKESPAVQSKPSSDSSGSEVLEGPEISDHQANNSRRSQYPILHDPLEIVNCSSQPKNSAGLLNVHAIGAATSPILQIKT